MNTKQTATINITSAANTVTLQELQDTYLKAGTGETVKILKAYDRAGNREMAMQEYAATAAKLLVTITNSDGKVSKEITVTVLNESGTVYKLYLDGELYGMYANVSGASEENNVTIPQLDKGQVTIQKTADNSYLKISNDTNGNKIEAANANHSEDYASSTSAALEFKMPAYDVSITTGYYAVTCATGSAASYIQEGKEIKATGLTAKNGSYAKLAYTGQTAPEYKLIANGEVIFDTKMPAATVTITVGHYAYTQDGATKYTDGSGKIDVTDITSYTSAVDKDGKAQKFSTNAFADWAEADGEDTKFIGKTNLGNVVVDENGYVLTTGTRKVTIQLDDGEVSTIKGTPIVKINGKELTGTGDQNATFTAWVTGSSCEVYVGVINSDSFKFKGTPVYGTDATNYVEFTWKLTDADNTIDAIEANA